MRGILVAQWLQHVSDDRKAPGSNPAGAASKRLRCKMHNLQHASASSTVTHIIRVICIYFSRQLHIAVIIDSRPNYSCVDI